MNVRPMSSKRRNREMQLWLAAGAAFALAIFGFLAAQYLEAYGHNEGVLVAAVVMAWAGSIVALMLTIAAIASSIAAVVRRLIR